MMTPETKRHLSTTIRQLRERLLKDLDAATDAAWRLSLPITEAGLDEAARIQRQRFEAWVSEQLRSEDKKKRKGEDFRQEAVKQAAYTFLNRLILLRLMEVMGQRPYLLTGGYQSRSYQDFRDLAPALRTDDTEGYAYLLRLVFADLAEELPGLYGDAGIAELIPIPAATLRMALEALNQEGLELAWTDDMTLGWVYQYWNDPEREALDDAVKDRHSIQRHEIASKTQMFTDRYMVDWLLQNSLGPIYLSICRRNGWTTNAESILNELEQRRIAWRTRQERGEVSTTDLMPLHSNDECRWAYYVPQTLPDHPNGPRSVQNLKILDPAMGSGHFLVVAVDLLFAMYREEAQHRKLDWSDAFIVTSILENNLFGLDIDPRAVQMGAAALWLKARTLAPTVRPRRLNLVSAALRLTGLPDTDPALQELRTEIERETSIPAKVTDTLLAALRGADHLGSLLRVDQAVDEALSAVELTQAAEPVQLSMFSPAPAQQQRLALSPEKARATVQARLEGFLSAHTSASDLGLRLRGEQFSQGVRFVRMLQPGMFDLVIANPPYHSAGKLAEDAQTYQALYPMGRADLFAAFILRSMELVKPGGYSATVTLSNWMFLKVFSEFRAHMLTTYQLALLGDLGKGSFSSGSNLISASTQIFVKRAPSEVKAIALRPYDEGDTSTDQYRVSRNTAALLSGKGRFAFDPAALKVVPEWPLVYWWDAEFLKKYAVTPKLGTVAPARAGMQTSNNIRFLRNVWEVKAEIRLPIYEPSLVWAPYLKGSSGAKWIDGFNDLVRWKDCGLEKQVVMDYFGSNGGGNGTPSREYYFKIGIAIPKIGDEFSGRVHRVPSILGDAAASIYPEDIASTVCLLNSKTARFVLESLNPTVNFAIGTVASLHLAKIANATEIFAMLETAFSIHESHREPSVEYQGPGPSPWKYAQEWAQIAVDRAEGAPLPPYTETLEKEPATDHLSHALGVVLGRFNPQNSPPDPMLFLDLSHEGDALPPLLQSTWAKYGPTIAPKRSLKDYLALDFFKDVHRPMYENRPIHWPLSSTHKTFVVWINIHQWSEKTLRIVLADHLVPRLSQIDGELVDLRAARDGADKKAAREAEKTLDRRVKAREELLSFIADVTRCADIGPETTDAKCPKIETEARYAPVLDDGVMINSAALWKLLDPQWKDPKKWWKELASAEGKKDYDWSQLARKYFPKRVADKCKKDPSLSVAHGCFWANHPARAWAWELRLQAEIGPDFRIEGHNSHRLRYLSEAPEAAIAAIEKEALRRGGRGKDQVGVAEMHILEAGLWSLYPEKMWAMELRVAEKQGCDFVVLAPDVAERSAWALRYPEQVVNRRQRLAQLQPAMRLYEEAAAEEEEDA